MRRLLKPLAIAGLATAALLAAPGASSSVAAGDVRTLATVNGLSAGLSARPGVLVYAGIRDSGESVPSDPDDFTDLFTVRADGSGFRRLTRTTVWEDDPAWAPNRRLIAYSRATPFCHANTCGWDPGEASIWLMAARRPRPPPAHLGRRGRLHRQAPGLVAGWQQGRVHARELGRRRLEVGDLRHRRRR